MKVRNFSLCSFKDGIFCSEWILFISRCHVDSHPSLFPGRPRRRRQDHPQTMRSWQPWLHPRSRLNIMTQETTGAETVTSPLVPCLIFSHTCTAKHIERFVKGFLSLSSVRDFVSCEGGLTVAPVQFCLCLHLHAGLFSPSLRLWTPMIGLGLALPPKL